MHPIVLAVDDDDKMRKLVKVNLQTDGIEVQEANTGDECLRLVRDSHVDLVLLDLDSPDIGGLDLLATLRSTAATRSIPVIVLSAAPPERAMLRRYKPEDCVQKPFDARDLTERVRKILSRQG